MTLEDLFPQLSALNWLGEADIGLLDSALADTDLHVLRLDGARVSDAPSILAAFETLLGRRFAAGGWDALRDVLPEIVGRVPSGRSCLVWTHADVMLAGGLPDLVKALMILVEMSHERAARGGRFITFMVGKGANFPPSGPRSS